MNRPDTTRELSNPPCPVKCPVKNVFVRLSDVCCTLRGVCVVQVLNTETLDKPCISFTAPVRQYDVDNARHE